MLLGLLGYLYFQETPSAHCIRSGSAPRHPFALRPAVITRCPCDQIRLHALLRHLLQELKSHGPVAATHEARVGHTAGTDT